MNNSKGKCLILNGYCRNSLAITRSLGNKGFVCDIAVPEMDNPKTNAFYLKHKSKFVDKVHLINSSQSELEQLISILKQHDYDYLLAGGTKWSNFISKHKTKLSEFTIVAAEDYDKMMRVHDKHQAIELVKKLGINHPQSFIAKDKKSLEIIAEQLNGKAIVKMSDSFASKGLVVFEKDASYFIENYIKTYGFDYKDDEYPIIQQLLKGALFDTTAFSKNGKPIAILSQKRVVTAWLKGGGGVVNRTTHHPEIIEETKKILSELSWNGHMEIDWMFNELDNQFYFIEVNPKFWGTTQLTISAGYDFPYWNTLLYSNQPIPENLSYKKGLTFRWLEDELYAIAEHSENLAIFFWEFTKFLGRFFRPNTKYSIYWNDFKPFKGNMTETLWLIIKRRVLRKR